MEKASAPNQLRDLHVVDAPPDNWVENWLPRNMVPYAQLMRLDRPIGWWLLLLPCWWGLLLGQIATGAGLLNGPHLLWHSLLFLAGAIVMRGAGCTLNDIADRDFDAKVTRTRSRPIPSGRVSRRQALVFLALQLLVGLIIILQFNRYTILLAISSLLIVAIYPFMKRITHWPQAVLGLAFNWGAMLGWTATHGSLSLPPLLLYGGGIFWTLAYDTIYAHQDKEDDVLIGVKSTALLFGANTKPWLGFFFAIAGLLIAASLFSIGAGWFAYAGLAAAALHGTWQIVTFDHANPNHCLKLFRANRMLGLLLAAGLSLDLITT